MYIASHCKMVKPSELFQAALGAGWMHGPGSGPQCVA